ncbi:unnamed protein product [Psylliodes chrysocephalus]|uniref:Aminopeptidase n=1 Tax=Psylliodes chrysocephalus TaxID=3402493 RepID=A0A9P0CMW1_9CUCU|nr:unnamed protein product [Psylliodes chrysocephala]
MGWYPCFIYKISVYRSLYILLYDIDKSSTNFDKMALGSRMQNFMVLFFIIIVKNVLFTNSEVYRLPRSIIPNTYTVRLKIPDVHNNTYTGTEVITFTTVEQVDKILMNSSPVHINITKIDLNEDGYIHHCSWNYTDNLTDIVSISCNKTLESNQVYSIMLNYESIFSSDDQFGFYKIQYKEKDNEEMVLLTRLSPTYARRVFPCFDEPTFKATFNFFVAYPRTYHILGNTPVVTEVNSVEGLTESQFDTTPMMSTYSIGFIVSKLKPVIEEITDVDFAYNVFTKPSFKRFGKTMIDQSSKLVNAMGEWTGTKYHEMGNIQLYSIPIEHLHYGEANNWGLLVSREEYSLDEETNTTALQKQTIILNLANQITQQWFGSYVSLNWWSNTWLNLGFAKFFEYYISNQVNTGFDFENQFIINVLQNSLYEDSILSFDELSSKEEDIVTQSDILKKINKLMSNKGASIIRMMQSILGKELFRNSMISHINQFKFNNTNPTFLLDSLNLGNLMEPYLYTPGYPLVTVKLDENQKTAVITQEPFSLINDENMQNTYWNIPITYTSSAKKDLPLNEIQWLRSNNVLNINLNSEWIILNNQQIGYFRVNYDDELWTRIIHVLKGSQRTDINVINRAQLIDDIFAVARVGKVQYSKAFLLVSYITHETDYYPWVTALKVMKTLFNQLSDKDTLAILKKNILNWINTAFPNIHAIDSTLHIEIMKQSLILNWKCFLGDTTCLTNARNKYEEFKLSKTFQNYNERDTVLCYGAKRSEKAIDEYSYLIYLYQNTNTQTKKTVLLSAIGCISDKEVLKNYLRELVVTVSVISKYDALTVFEAVSSNENEGVDLALQFLDDNILLIIDRYSEVFPLTDFIISISDKISTQSQLDKLKTLIDSHIELQDNSSSRSLKIIENNLKWANNYTDAIRYTLEHPLTSASSRIHKHWVLVCNLLVISYFIKIF